MATNAHLTCQDTSGARHMLAVDYSDARHLLCLKTATYSSKAVIVTPSAGRYAVYAYRANYDDIEDDGASIVSACWSGLTSKTAANWQTGHKGILSYYGRDNCPSINPYASSEPYSYQRTEACGSACAYYFDLYDLPSLYTISSASLLLYRPSLLTHNSRMLAGSAYRPTADDLQNFADFWTMHSAFNATLQAPGYFYSGSQHSASMLTLSDATKTAAQIGEGSTVSSSLYNFWGHTFTGSGSSEIQTPARAGIVPVYRDGGSYYGGIWIESALSSGALSALSGARAGVWLHVGHKMANAFYFSSGTGYLLQGNLTALFVGGVYLKLTLNGG